MTYTGRHRRTWIARNVLVLIKLRFFLEYLMRWNNWHGISLDISLDIQEYLDQKGWWTLKIHAYRHAISFNILLILMYGISEGCMYGLTTCKMYEMVPRNRDLLLKYWFLDLVLVWLSWYGYLTLSSCPFHSRYMRSALSSNHDLFSISDYSCPELSE